MLISRYKCIRNKGEKTISAESGVPTFSAFGLRLEKYACVIALQMK